MAVALTLTVNATQFDKRSSEVAYLARVLEIAAAAELLSKHGDEVFTWLTRWACLSRPPMALLLA
jgi:hypothetical protein